jgi:HAD superfamily hydrolase (TIGR01509 family)
MNPLRADPPAFPVPELLVLDCDGVVIDSEIISAQTLVALLSEAGIGIDVAYVRRHFLGRSFPTVARLIEASFELVLPDNFEIEYRQRLLARFETDLRVMDGLEPLLDRLHVPFCLATSSSPVRVTRSLKLTGLYERFEGRIFTASQVARGKPAPDLFLHAAKSLGVAPGKCVVVEDSSVGLQSGLAAGMQAVWFTGGSHLKGMLRESIEIEGFPDGPHHRIEHLAHLFEVLPSLGRVKKETSDGV